SLPPRSTPFPYTTLFRSHRPVHVGLVAADEAGYGEMEEFLIAGSPPGPVANIHRAGEADVPKSVDVILYQAGIPHERGTYTYDRSEEHTSELQSRVDLVC